MNKLNNKCLDIKNKFFNTNHLMDYIYPIKSFKYKTLELSNSTKVHKTMTKYNKPNRNKSNKNLNKNLNKNPDGKGKLNTKIGTPNMYKFIFNKQTPPPSRYSHSNQKSRSNTKGTRTLVSRTTSYQNSHQASTTRKESSSNRKVSRTIEPRNISRLYHATTVGKETSSTSEVSRALVSKTESYPKSHQTPINREITKTKNNPRLY